MNLFDDSLQDDSLQDDFLSLYPLINPQPIVIMSEDSFYSLIKYIDSQTLFFIFTLTCFSTLICCSFRDRYQYKIINQENTSPNESSV